MRLAGKVAVVTGAAGAIGSAIVRRFVREGAFVALLDNTRQGLAHVVDALSNRSQVDDRMLPLYCNVENPVEVDAAFSAIDDRWNQVDIAVANAGIAVSRPFLDMDLELWDRILAINLTGVMLVCQRAAQRMVPRGSGVLITMSSTNGMVAERDLAAYNASKAGVLLLTKTMAIELAPFGIRANSLNPGMIDTGLAQRSGMDPSTLRDYKNKIPMQRFGSPDEVAAVTAFLASDDAAFVTGTGIVIDGGQLAEE